MYGEVRSPQFPQPYPPNLLKQWDLSVPDGYQIQLTFTHLDIEPSTGCHYDALMALYDQKVLGRFCGQENSADGNHPGNQPILSPGNRFTLTFQTDSTNPELHQHIGFSAYYQAIDMDECSAPDPEDGSGPICSQICLNTLGSYFCSCHHGYELRPDQRTCVLSCGAGIFDESEGHLSSPGYPDPSPHDMSCQYVISVEPGFTVTLNFTDNFHIESIDTEQGPKCLFQWLQVTIPEREPTKLCGRESPGLIDTNSNNVKLDYYTDGIGLSHGWSLDYSTHRVKCPFPSGVANGRVTPVFPEYFYRDYISVRCGLGYKLMMDGTEVKSYSTMCQSNGQWHLSPPECQIIDCGEPDVLLNGRIDFISGSENQYHSVIQYFCNEPFYSLPGEGNVCGQPRKLITGYQRIIGGSAAPKNTIPWQALVNVDGARGGGMVIGAHWIMTAAHVLVRNNEQVNKDQIFMGSNNVHELINSSAAGIAAIYIHPQYDNPHQKDFNNDIALIKLMVSGFGSTRENGRDILSNDLKYIRLPVVDQGICQDSVNKAKKTESVPVLSSNMFCAGIPESGKDSCQGDSGSALALRDSGRFWAAGIVSWGVGCGQLGRYGVYTRVGNYVDWLNKTMEEN
ncbi:complement component 1, r subcomponent [Diretmus argenteus]